MNLKQFEILYQKIEILMQKTRDPVHDWKHVLVVKENAFKIKQLLPTEIQAVFDDYLLTLICLWHDVSYTQHKSGFIQYFLEGARSAKIVRRIFRAVGVDKKEIDLVCDVIFYHPTFFWRLNRKRGLYHQLLNDADFLENFSSGRIERAIKSTQQSLFRIVVMKVLKPLGYGFLKQHKIWFFNFKESLAIYSESKK